jgi:small subunit ribosomal protein S5e
MSDNGEVEVAAYPSLPKEIAALEGEIKLFGKWSYECVKPVTEIQY